MESVSTLLPNPFTTDLRHYHRGYSNFARRYYWNHCCFLFLPLLICLSPRGYLLLRNKFELKMTLPSSLVNACCRVLHRYQCLSIPRAWFYKHLGYTKLSLLILPQVHLPQPCYDLYPIYKHRFVRPYRPHPHLHLR